MPSYDYRVEALAGTHFLFITCTDRMLYLAPNMPEVLKEIDGKLAAFSAQHGTQHPPMNEYMILYREGAAILPDVQWHGWNYAEGIDIHLGAKNEYHAANKWKKMLRENMLLTKICDSCGAQYSGPGHPMASELVPALAGVLLQCNTCYLKGQA